MAIGTAALMEHITKTSAFQHGGNRLPSLEEDEQHEKKIAYLATHRTEINAAAQEKLVRTVAYVRSLDGTEKHIPLVKLEEIYKAAIRHQGRVELRAIRDDVIRRVERFPMRRNRTNYLSLVKWRDQAKKTVWSLRKFASDPVSDTTKMN